MAEIIVAVMGNVGSGKTEFTQFMEQKALGSRLLPLLTTPGELKVYYESPKVIETAVNVFYPALKEKDPYRCYAAEIEMLYLRRDWMKQIIIQSGIAVMDRTLFENRYVFFENIYKAGLVKPNMYENYCLAFDYIISQMPSPDVFVYLSTRPEVAFERVRKRARPGEETMTLEYFINTNVLYEDLITTILPRHIPRYGDKIVVIDANKENTEAELKVFHDQIEERIEMVLLKGRRDLNGTIRNETDKAGGFNGTFSN